MEQAGRTLADHLQSRLDEQLQVVIAYEHSTRTIVYIREDLREHISSSSIFETVNIARDINNDLSRVCAPSLATGDARFSVHAFENTLILHFLGEGEGIVIGVEPEVGRGLIEFVNECFNEIELPRLELS